MPNQRHWCATFWSEPNYKAFTGRYAIFGEEICPSTGKVHWQSYLEFQEKIGMKTIKQMLGDNKAHLSTRQGTREQARDYCKKDNKFKELGVWCKGPGFRTDLAMASKEIFEGKTRITDLMESEPILYCKYRNGLKDIQAEADKRLSKEFRKVKVTVLSGPTGCGKTRQAMEQAQFKTEGKDIKWWDGYQGEEKILIDEYDNDVGITQLLNILDGYQLRLQVKGSHTYAKWTEVYITTNLTKDELHAQAKHAHREALFRRITDWIDFWEEEKEVRGTTG